MGEYVQKNRIRWNISKAMSYVYDALKKSKLKITMTDNYSVSLDRLCKFYSLNKIQIWILCMVCERYAANDTSFEMRNFSDILDVSAMSIMNWKKEVEFLIDKGFFKWDIDGKEFQPTDIFMNSLYENTGFEAEPQKQIDDIVFLSHVGYGFCNRRANDRSARSVQREMAGYEKNCEDLDVVKRVKAELEELEDRIFLYDIAYDVIRCINSSLNITIEDLYDGVMRYSVAGRMMDESDILFKKGLLEFTSKGNLSDASITLTSKAKKLVFGDKAFLFEDTLDEKLLIMSDSIKAKKLFYSMQNQKEIDRLKNALQDETLKKIQERLETQGLPSGVAVLLYGAPGTGKTESVLQIARETCRNVVHVDISETKSAWFGESEKRIKKIFTSYRNVCEICRKKGEKIPILLFNEADAIISKRKDSSAGNCAQTENAIQNIILEELENLDGIFIATTNLVVNMDGAFERRFLFKVKFENPSIESKTCIWKDKLSWLDENQAKGFACDYDFSGGQIDNIVRKITMNEVITGERPSMSEIHEMCRNERIENEKHGCKIGFSV